MAEESPPPFAIHGDPATGKLTASSEDAPILHAPDDKTTDFIWRAIVLTACTLTLVAGCALVVAMFVASQGRVTAPEVTIIFTLVFGFLSGLLANKARQNNS